MKTFKNKAWKERDYETTNVVACQGPAAPSDGWEECCPSILNDLQPLWREGETNFFGYL
jgi:hypothetical protein